MATTSIPVLTEEQVVEALCEKEPNHFIDWDDFAHDCHSVSLALVKSGLLGEKARVARGSLRGVGGQHSWAVVGDPYAPEAVVDLTAWSYDERYPRLYVVEGPDAPHVPHGTGSIWDWGIPPAGDGPDIDLTPTTPLSQPARVFLGMVAEGNGRKGLDLRGWMALANAPVEEWPAAEVLAAMDDTQQLRALIPIDRLGMLTDRNPGGLYR